jgi:predicted nucleic acid-binding protein
MNRIALDTNILIYLHDAEEKSSKREKANELVAGSPSISAQVISEYLNVCHRQLKMTKQDALTTLTKWLPYCELCSFELSIYTYALNLIQKYQFQMFDAIIVASAIKSSCSILYSEDMQHNLMVDGKLKIVNPFY